MTTPSEIGSQPLLIYNKWKQNAVIGFVIGFIFLGTFTLIYSTNGLPPANYSNLALIPQSYYAYGVIIFFCGAGPATGIYYIITGTTGEFYEDYLRIIPRRGEPRDIPYSQMYLEWGNTGGKNNRSYVILSTAQPSGKYKTTFRAGNMKIDKLNITLFAWLTAKFAHFPGHTIGSALTA